VQGKIYLMLHKLFENFRRYINEELSTGLGLSIYDLGGDHIFLLYDVSLLTRYVQELEKDNQNVLSVMKEFFSGDVMDSPIPIGMISINKYKECMGSYEVNQSAISKRYQGKGNAKLLYGLAQAYVYPNGLMPDRDSITYKAQKVWQSMDQKTPKSDKIPPDEAPYKGEFDNIANPATKPKEDDCRVYSSANKDLSFLNKAYKNDKYKSLLKQYEQNSDNFINDFSKKYSLKFGDVETLLYRIANSLFDNEYRV
jgi:hypothetical protein